MGELILLDEGPHHVVVLKGPNQSVVRGRGVPRPTLLDQVEDRFAGARPVHRLDRVTTGACLFAKDLYGQQALSDAFRRHLVDKRYLALVEGAPDFDALEVDARLLKVEDQDAKKGPLAWVKVDERGQRARTRLTVVARSEAAALLLCQPHTGRMHQIRVHCAHVGHPIVGDAQYGATTTLGPHHVALHAVAVGFPRPDGGRSFVIAPVHAALVAKAKELGLDVGKAIAPLVESFEARRKAEKERPATAAKNAAGRGAAGKKAPTKEAGPPRGQRGAAGRGKSGPSRGGPSSRSGPATKGPARKRRGRSSR